MPIAAGPPPGHGWPSTKTRCLLMMLAVVKGVLVTTRCHARHSSLHSAEVDRPWWSKTVTQCSGAHWTWDLVVRLALLAELVSTLPVVGAYTGTSLNYVVCVRACVA